MSKMTKYKVDILAIGVHPDDIELSCSASLLKHIDLGYAVGLLDLTRGEMGSRGTIGTRKKEAEAARKMMGATHRFNAELKDAFFQYSESSINKIIRFIRLTQPELVLCNAINDRHPDHGRAAKLVSDACYYSGLAKIKTTHGKGKQEHWRPKAVYHYIQDYNLEPDFVVDVDGYFEKKLDLIRCFKTQFYNPKFKAQDTPISSKEFLDFLDARARVHGRHIGATYGEGFTIDRYIGVKNFFDLK